MSKIEIATDIIKSLPNPVKEGYLLCASRYSCKALFDASKAQGYTYIGALKTNRVIYPKCHEKLGIKVHAFSKTLSVKDVSLVTAGNREYYVYTYKGKLNDLNEAVIVLSWPKDSLFSEYALKAFISLEGSIDAETILNHYVYRWSMEIFFRESKRYLGLDDYQVRTEKATKRFFILLMLTYVYYGFEVSGDTLNFSKGIKAARKEAKQNQVAWIYE